MAREPYRAERIPRTRRSAVDAGRFGRHKNIFHALVQADVTEARRALSACSAQAGKKLSFTAYVIHSLGRAVHANPHLHAYLNWRRRLVIFQHVNIATMIEVDWEGYPVPMPHVLKRVDERDYLAISDELRSVQTNPSTSPGWRYLKWFVSLPGFLRRSFAWIVMRVPRSFRAYSSPVLVTAVGMFGKGGGWGIPKPSQTLTVTLGGIAERPGVVEGEIEIREYLDITISIDHDIVDGAPAARFIEKFRRTLEQAAALRDLGHTSVEGV